MSDVDVQSLSVNFGGVRAVQNVSFRVPAGSIFSIIGPNGAGKSTVFNLLTRVTPASSGSVMFAGTNLLKQKPSQIARVGVARTFQNLELFANATVIENILAGRHIHFSTSPFAEMLGSSSVKHQEWANRARVNEIISFLGLHRHRDTPVGSLSYGICKIVELGRALAVEPQLLLLDEPAAGLNISETMQMADWIQHINAKLGTTIILIEHDMQLVSRVSHRVLALNAGQVLAEGTAVEVQNHPDVIKSYIGA